MPFGDALSNLRDTSASTTRRIFFSFPDGQTTIRVLDTENEVFAFFSYPLDVVVNGQRARRMIPVRSLNNPIAAYMSQLSPDDPRFRRPQRRLVFNILVRPSPMLPVGVMRSEVKLVEIGPMLTAALSSLDRNVRHPVTMEMLPLQQFDVVVNRSGSGLRTMWSAFPVLTDEGLRPVDPVLYAQRHKPEDMVVFFDDNALEQLLNGADYLALLRAYREQRELF